jgi:hypothetical protein
MLAFCPPGFSQDAASLLDFELQACHIPTCLAAPRVKRPRPIPKGRSCYLLARAGALEVPSKSRERRAQPQTDVGGGGGSWGGGWGGAPPTGGGGSGADGEGGGDEGEEYISNPFSRYLRHASCCIMEWNAREVRCLCKPALSLCCTASLSR